MGVCTQDSYFPCEWEYVGLRAAVYGIDSVEAPGWDGTLAPLH